MKNFTYFRPQTAEQAVGLLDAAWGSSELLAGGTDLLDRQKDYVATPEKVISLSGIKALAGVHGPEDDKLTIGAGTRLADLAASAAVREHFPALAMAASIIGGPQIRNMGTVGGNLCQRNRCWYFRDEHVHCLLKGGDKCFALDGENRYHAIFTKNHPCVIVNPSTLAPGLIALGASVEVLGPQGKRSLEVAKLFHAPVKADEREHVLKSNEIILSVTVPVRGLKNASYEVRHKQSYDWPLVQAVAAFKLEDGKASGVHVVLGHVAPTPHASHAAAQALEGKEVTEETAAAAGKAAVHGAKPLAQNEYKVKLAEVAVKRAVLLAAGQKRYWEA